MALDAESGLWLPLGAADPRDAGPLLTQARLDPKTGLIVAAQRPPTGLDQVGVFLPEEWIDDLRATFGAMRATLANLPFENVMVVLAQWAAIAREVAASPAEAQVEFAQRMLPPSTVLTNVLKALSARERVVLLSEQQVLITMRFAVEYASAAEAEALNAFQVMVLGRLTIGAGTLIADSVKDVERADSTVKQQMVHFVRNGAYNSKPPPMNDLVRSHEIFEQILPRLASAGHPETQPIEQWMTDDYGLSLAEQFLLGFSLAAVVHAFDDGFAAGDQVLIHRVHVDDVYDKLGWGPDKRDAAEALIAANREEYRRAFAELGNSEEDVIWETRPFMSKPFLKLGNGNLVLLSPRAIQSWMTEGIYYRLLRSAQTRGQSVSQSFTAFFGAGLEEYALDLTRSAFPGERRVGAGRVYGEQRYGRDQNQKTSDVIIDLGTDVVVVEVTGSRLSAAMVVAGDEDRLDADLKRLVIKKLKQLDGCIEALTTGEATVPAGAPEIDFSRVQRIWPVLVTGNLTMLEPLADMIGQELADEFKQPKVQRLSILDMSDYEFLLGLLEAGHHVPAVLDASTTPPYDRLQFAVWLNREAASDARAPTFIEDRYKSLTARLIANVDFTVGLPPSEG